MMLIIAKTIGANFLNVSAHNIIRLLRISDLFDVDTAVNAVARLKSSTVGVV